jgi:monoterpene epsilon-lactone hydrolase
MDNNIKKVIELLRENGPTPDLSIEQARTQLTYAYLQISDELEIDTINLPHCTAKLFSLPNQSHESVILFAHGGGFNIGSVDDHIVLIRRLVLTSDMPVLAVDYRLAPEHLYPAQLDDMVDAYQYLLDQKIKPNKVSFCGLSAGAILSLVSLLKVKALNLPLPGCAVAMSPLTDFSSSEPAYQYNAENDWIVADRLENIPSVILQEGADLKDPFLSPLYGDFTNMPPILLQVGGHELLIDDNINFYRKHKAAGVNISFEVWREMVHCWQMFSRFVPQGQLAIESACEFIKDKQSEDTTS